LFFNIYAPAMPVGVSQFLKHTYHYILRLWRYTVATGLVDLAS
jgi:hypothetical protein